MNRVRASEYNTRTFDSPKRDRSYDILLIMLLLPLSLLQNEWICYRPSLYFVCVCVKDENVCERQKRNFWCRSVYCLGVYTMLECVGAVGVYTVLGVVGGGAVLEYILCWGVCCVVGVCAVLECAVLECAVLERVL